jgi:hypothetical protein
MKVMQTTGYLGSIEDSSIFLEARITHIVDVELQVATIH